MGFKIGDKVVCVKNINRFSDIMPLTIGKVYTILEMIHTIDSNTLHSSPSSKHYIYYKLYGDNGDSDFYSSYLFITMSENRNSVINYVLDLESDGRY